MKVWLQLVAGMITSMTSALRSLKTGMDIIGVRIPNLFNLALGFVMEAAVDSVGIARTMGSDIIDEHGFGNSTQVPRG